MNEICYAPPPLQVIAGAELKKELCPSVLFLVIAVQLLTGKVLPDNDVVQECRFQVVGMDVQN